MKKHLAVISAIAMLGFVASAHADQSRGTIAKIEPYNWITLGNGMIFKLGTIALGPSWHDEAKLREGDEISINWHGHQLGYMMADKVTILRRK